VFILLMFFCYINVAKAVYNSDVTFVFNSTFVFVCIVFICLLLTFYCIIIVLLNKLAQHHNYELYFSSESISPVITPQLIICNYFLSQPGIPGREGLVVLPALITSTVVDT